MLLGSFASIFWLFYLSFFAYFYLVFRSLVGSCRYLHLVTTFLPHYGPSLRFNHLCFLGPVPMTNVKLNCKTYVYWSQFVEVYLQGKGLYSHLESGQPPKNSSTSLWDQAGNQIISHWILVPLSSYCNSNLGSSLAYILWY